MLLLAIKNLLRNKLRTFITVSGIAIGALLVSTIIFAMISLRDLLVFQFATSFKPETIFLHSLTPETNFKSADIQKLKDIDGVKNVYPGLSFTFTMPNERLGGTIKAFPDEYYMNMPAFAKALKEGTRRTDSLPIKEGHAIVSRLLYNELHKEHQKDGKNSANNKNATDIVIMPPFEFIPTRLSSGDMQSISPETKAMLARTIKKTVLIDGYVASRDMENGYIIYMPLNDAQKLILELTKSKYSINKYADYVGYNIAIVQAKSTKEVERVVSTIRGIFNSNNVMVSAATEALDMVNKMLYILGGTLLFIALFSTVVASLGIINTMVMSVYEQKREIGILKALGATNFQVFSLYAIMSALIGLLGGTLGVLLSVGLFKIADPFIIKFLSTKGIDVDYFFIYKTWVILLISAISALIGFMSGILPALKAAKMDPIKAIRG